MVAGTIIDRRKNPKGKNLPNRQRFVNRSKDYIKKSIKEKILKKPLTDENDEYVSVPVDSISEPQFQHDKDSGNGDIVLPGNEAFSPGDLIAKPKGSGQGGKKATDDGEGEDEFEFLISASEYHDLLFEGLDLPNLKKKALNKITKMETRRSGHTIDGTPNNLDLIKSVKNSLSRRIALKFPKLKLIEKLKEELEYLENKPSKSEEDENRILEIKQEISSLRSRANTIGFIEPLDLRYKNFKQFPKPNHQAVMFCVMDVSGSMGEKEKELAKRFYLLLYLFLQRKYEVVDIVFIRHHTMAKECDEQEFFHSKESGGTVVSSGFELMNKIQQERYSENDWNIYVAQASDGDNMTHDNEKLLKLLNDKILPTVQYFAYVEVGENIITQPFFLDVLGHTYNDESNLWKTYSKINNEFLKMKKIEATSDIFPVFRELFAKEES